MAHMYGPISLVGTSTIYQQDLPGDVTGPIRGQRDVLRLLKAPERNLVGQLFLLERCVRIARLEEFGFNRPWLNRVLLSFPQKGVGF
jgi:hypothetical protein